MDFGGALGQFAGQTLRDSARNTADKNDRVSDDFLRWHLRQAVLVNLKGTGRKPWERDLGKGGDDLEEERMEVELFTRLGAGDLDSVRIRLLDFLFAGAK